MRALCRQTGQQYRAQEELTAVAKKHDVQLTLFHGRGGSISRGGAPTQQALFSQPPGSISGASPCHRTRGNHSLQVSIRRHCLTKLEKFTPLRP